MADEDRELFEAALSDAPAETPAPETPAPQPEAEAPTPEPRADETGRLHGPGGKFVPKTPKEAPTEQPAQAAPVVQPEAQKEPDHRVPLTELLNEREKRQRFEQEIAQERQQREALQRELQALKQPPKPAPDIFEDPQGFVGNLRQEFQQNLRNQEVNFSLRLAHKDYKEEFENAYASAVRAREQGDPAIQAIYNSPDPGEALMKWHRSRSLLEKTGGNLEKYLETHTNSLLEDEAFLAKAAERIRARSNGAQPSGQRPASIVSLPPSLNKIAAAQSATDESDNDMSDRALFNFARR